jgi:hypothetical protein
MLPDTAISAKRKKAGLISGALTSCGLATYVLLTSPPLKVEAFVALACVAIGNAAVVFVGWPDTDGFLIRDRDGRSGRGRSGRGRSGRGRGGGQGGLGLEGDTGRVPVAAARRPVLRTVARLMPREAGRRWLAEAESLLFEIPGGRRGQAVRSYLWSAPRLVVMMWARQLRSRTNRRA